MNTPEQLNENEAKTLDRAAEKLVLYGEQVCVDAEEMIALLDAGISIRELLFSWQPRVLERLDQPSR